MFISQAYAQAAGGGGGDAFVTLLPLVLIFAVFYFLLIRPQQKKMKQHKAMVEAVRRGDKVVTAGGIIGTVTKVASDTEVQLEIADNVRVRVVKGTLSDVLSKTEPSKAKGGEGAKAANDDQQAGGGGRPGGGAANMLSKLLGGGKKG